MFNHDAAVHHDQHSRLLGVGLGRTAFYLTIRGKDFLYRLVYPDGASKILLSVPRFDFGWQLTYVLKEPVAAPKGSRLEAIAHHDNSANNKFNPDPSKEVKWGDQTWDEMMIGYFDYTLDKQNLRLAAAQPSGAP